MTTTKRLLGLVLALVALAAIGGAQAQSPDAGAGVELTETSPNDLSMLSDDELMAELERRKAFLEDKEKEDDVSASPDQVQAQENVTDSIYLSPNETEALVSAPVAEAGSLQDPVRSFVQVRDGAFVVRTESPSGGATCEPFFLTGWNSWDVTRVPRIQSYRSYNGQRALTEQLMTASKSGLNVLRAWAHTIDPSYPVMSAPFTYDEEGLKAIDFLVSEAGKYGIRVILSFVDNWKYPGGVDQILDWSDTAENRTMAVPESLLAGGDYNQDALGEDVKEYIVRRHALFYTDQGAREIYRDYVKTLVNRKNVYNGNIYKDDPAILAWNLINEPRCESWLVEGCEQMLQDWIESEAAYVKSEDPNHLVTIGEEGFWSSDSPNEYANPTWWAKKMGQNFRLNHSPKDIDFATIHIWPDTWSRPEDSFQKSWILEHAKEAQQVLGKPLVLEEFGKSIEGSSSFEEGVKRRDDVFRSAQGLVEEAALAGNGLAGSLFWNWETDLIRSPGSYEINAGDSTFQLVRDHAKRMQDIQAQVGAPFQC